MANPAPATWAELSWLMAAFMALFGAVTLLTGDPLAGFFVAVGDLLLRAPLKRLHDRLWRRP